MEKPLDIVIQDVMHGPKVLGCVFADHQGLCLAAQGIATNEDAGVIAAIAEQAAKLEPNGRSSQPVVRVEGELRTCMIQRAGTITGAVFKSV